MRRLPVYLLLDTSGSMYGEPIEAVKNGVQTLISTLRGDPYALETAYISIITFNSTAQQVTPLTELSAFQQSPSTLNDNHSQYDPRLSQYLTFLHKEPFSLPLY